ncbi:40S ribosomal protein S27-like [Hyaena hyaena]|uniref:40S ribosomal protein S27-like n=1 Tax=Hyaena hyaena TaxID=95912 RepID=UPI00192479D1|nr:40S ribosomal protein S27-like [Hyaena hyaena]
MDVKCSGCYKVTTIVSDVLTVVLCVRCSTVLGQLTGGKARFTEGCSFRRSTKSTLNQQREIIPINTL